MSNANPTRPNAPEGEARIDRSDYAPETIGPPLKDPRSRAAIDNIGVEDQGNLLDEELDDQPGDLEPDGRSFLDDVRSDGNDDENKERR